MQREMHIMRSRQAGFSLLAAIFIITVLATLAAFLLIASGVGQQTPVLGLNGAQAYHAARSGLEWGIAGAVNTDNPANCNGNLVLGNYNVAVTCSNPPSSHTDGGNTVRIYVINAVATRAGANPGDLAYARRQLRAVASPDGPF